MDHVEDGVTGWLHEPGDFKKLAAQMLEAISSPETRQKRGANGRELLLQRSANVWINEFNDFVGRILEKSGSEISSIQNSTFKIQNCRAAVPPSSASSSNPQSSIVNRQSSIVPSSSQHLHLTVYLADQNPGHDRSFGISRMSHVVLEALQARGQVAIEVISSHTSQQAPDSVNSTRILPWGTRRKWVRLLTDHFHPLFAAKWQ